MGLGSSCRSLGAAEEEEEEGCVGEGIASASRGLLPGETSRTGGPAFGSNLKVLALQGEDVDGHGGPRLNRVLRHLKGNVLVAVIAHVNPERVLLVLASEEEEEGDRSTSASSPSGGLRRPFLPRFPPPKARSRSQTLSQSRWGSPPLPRWQSPWPSCASLLPALGTPWLSLTVLAFFAERFPLAGLVSARCAPKSVRLACPNGSTRPATHFVVGSKFVFRGASQRCILYTPHSVQESTPGFARSRLDSCASPGPSKNLPNF